MIQALASVAGLGTKGTTTKGTSPVHSTPYSTVKASADSKLPIQSSVAAADVHEQVASFFFLVVFGLFKDEAAKKNTSTDHSREGTP